MRRTRLSSIFVLIVSGFLAGIWLLPVTLNPTGVPFWRSALFSDLLISHWPNALFLRRSLLLWNQIPMWNPTILSGYPFLADPLSGIWYPPLWLAVIFPSALAFNLLFWLHVVWAGFGMWRLAQSEGLSDLSALVSAVVFAGSPKWAAHIGLGHIGLVAAVSWTPWLLLSTRAALQSVAPGRESGFRLLGVNGFVLGMIFLADPRWLLPSLVLISFFALHVLKEQNLAVREQAAVAARWGFIAGLFSLGLVAGPAAALLRFVTNSTRGWIDRSIPDPFALQWGELSGLLLLEPDQPEKFIYMGLGAVSLAVVGILFSRRRSWFWVLIAILGLLISMGANLPILGPQLHALTGASLLRVPPRWYFLSILATAFLAGSGIEVVIEAPIRSRAYGVSAIALALLTAGVYLLAASRGVDTLGRSRLLLLPTAILALLILFRRSGWLHPRTFTLATVALLTIEFSVVNLFVLETREPPLMELEDSQALSKRVEPYGQSRIFSPSYSVEGLTAANEAIELADGVHPLQLESYWVYMARAVGFNSDDYSVTLPPFPTGDPGEPRPIRFDVEALSRLNIDTLVSAFPVPTEGLTLISGQSEPYVYAFEESRPRAWVELETDRSDAWEPAQLSYWSPNRIELVAEGPGRLVLSENAYPGWRARVDGEPTPVVVVDGLFRGVQLAAGVHRVEFVYRPAYLLAGFGFTFLTLLAALYLQVKR